MASRPLSVLALALAGALALSACSSDSTDGGDAPEVAASAEPSEPTVEPSVEASEQPAPDPTTEEPVEEKPLTYEDLVTGNLSNAEICASYQTLIDKYDAVIAKRTKSLDGKAEDPYKAARFTRKNAWVSEDLSTAYEDDWESAATFALNAVSDGQAGQLESVDEYLEASLESCGLDDAYGQQTADVKAIDSRQSAVVRQADRKPWYPKGYNEFGEIAWKWTDESCGTRYGYCWTMRVISDSGCYGGVYAEVNILQNGTIVGWSNDTLGSLPPGQKGKLAFTEYGGSGTKQAQLTELNCR